MENTDENRNPLQEEFESDTHSEDINLTYNDVPEFLRDSEFEFFTAWSADDSTTLSVPRGCFKADDTVNNVNDLAQLFKTFDYWEVSDVPRSALDICNRTDSTRWASAVSQVPGGETFRGHLTHITVKYRDIPRYLRSSAFYLSLSADDENEEFSIPRTCIKMDDTVSNVDDLGQILRVMIFWGIDRIPNSVLDFCGSNYVSLWQGVTSCFAQDCNIHKSLTDYFRDDEFTEWRSDIFAAAVDSGRMELIEYWMSRNPVGKLGGWLAAQHVAERGDLKALQILHANGYPLQIVDCALVAESGRIECLKYLRDNGATVDENCCYAAAENGHLECLRYLIESGCPRGDEDRLRELSAKGLHFDCYRYLSLPHNVDEAVGGISSSDDNESFRLILTVRTPLEELQALKNNGALWDESVTLAALCRELPFLQYVMLHGCPRTNDLILRAATLNLQNATFLAKLQFLVEDMLLPLSNELFTIAVMYGSVYAVQYLVDVGCPCEFVSLQYSVDFPLDDTSVLESMEYATSHGYSASDTFLHFVHHNHLPLCQANYSFPSKHFVSVGVVGEARNWGSLSDTVVCVAAARNQYLRLVYFVQSTSCLPHIAFSLAIVHGSVECLYYLVAVGCPSVFEVPLEFMMPNELHDARIARCLEYAMGYGAVRNEALDQFIFENDLPLCQAWLKDH